MNHVKDIKKLKDLSDFANYISQKASNDEERTVICYCFLRNRLRDFDSFFKQSIDNKIITGRFHKKGCIDEVLVVCKWAFCLKNGSYTQPTPYSKSRKQSKVEALYKRVSKVIQHHLDKRTTTTDFIKLIKKRGIYKMYDEYLVNRISQNDIYQKLCSMSDVDLTQITKRNSTIITVGIVDGNGVLHTKYVVKGKSIKGKLIRHILHKKKTSLP